MAGSRAAAGEVGTFRAVSFAAPLYGASRVVPVKVCVDLLGCSSVAASVVGARVQPAEMLALADLVADRTDRRVVWLRQDGLRKVFAGTTSFDELAAGAVEAGRMFAVRVASDVIAVDVDDPSAVDRVASFCAGAGQVGVEVVTVRSGRHGHVHLWCRAGELGTHRELLRLAESLGLEVRTGGFMRPPGSPSAFGRVQVVGGVGRACRVLGGSGFEGEVVAAPVVAPVVVARGELPPLSAPMERVLRRGDGNPDRSRTFQRVVVGMVNAGWSLVAAWDVLRRGTFAGAEKFNEKLRCHGPDVAYRYLAHCWANAEEFVDGRPAAGRPDWVVDGLERLQVAADAVAWPGEAGGVEWMVLHQLIQLALRGGCSVEGESVQISASERQVAELAGVSRDAVHGALGRLVTEGWLSRVSVGTGVAASVWEPNLELARTAVPVTHPLPCRDAVGGVVAVGLSVRAGGDAFRRGALGVNGYRVLRLLVLEGELSSGEIAARLGMNSGSVTRLLSKKLGAAGLVERVGRRWRTLDTVLLEREGGQVSGATLDAVAQKFGTVGRSVAQRRRHVAERDEYLQLIARARGAAAIAAA